MFLFIKTVYCFICGFFVKATFAHFLLIRSNGETHRNKLCFSEKTTTSSTFLLNKGFQGNVVNRSSPSFGGSLEITVTISL